MAGKLFTGDGCRLAQEAIPGLLGLEVPPAGNKLKRGGIGPSAPTIIGSFGVLDEPTSYDSWLLFQM
jgi:hypothetical protein